MELKKVYEEEIAYLHKMLERCKKELALNGLVQYHQSGNSRIGEVSPKLEVYEKVLDKYLKVIKEYNEYCKSLEGHK